MAYGLRIINDSSELLIDSDYINPTFIQKLEFNSTPTSTESGIYLDDFNQLHGGYLKSTYTTPVAFLNTGNYIVLWKLPDNGNIDVYYNFPTSVMDVNRTLTCEVYSGGSFSYTLPTAYIFAVDSGGLSTLSSSAYALRMYNSSEQLTFNSIYTQLIPYNFSSGLFPPYINELTNVSLPSTTNGIYLLPKHYYLVANDDFTNPGTVRQMLFDLMYKRSGSTIYMKSISSYWTSVSGSVGLMGAYGYTREASILTADGDLYQGANGSSVSTTAPTYTLGANYSTVNETNSTTITVTLTTANVTNGTLVYYNVTGIDATDLTSGSLNGSFTVQNNIATKSFVVAADTKTEYTETFLLTLVGITQSISISILDTSRGAYAWSAPSATSVDEGSSIYIDFNALYNDSIYPITFAVVYPATPIPGQSGETIYAYPDINFTYAIPSGANYTRVTVSPRADLQLEGLEKWRLRAIVDNTSYYSADITINDTTTSSITAANNWVVGTDNTVTINVIGGLGSTVYLLSSPDEAILLKSGSASSWYVNSNNFTVSTIYQAVGLYSYPGSSLQSQVSLFRQNAAGAQLEGLASKEITTSSPVAAYSWAITPLSVNEGQTQSLQFNYTNAPANTIMNFSLQPPASGTSATSGVDGTLNTTSFTTGAATSSGAVSVSYSITTDSLTEGVEKFLLRAAIGTSTYPSSDITINDTSLSKTYSITTDSNWAEGSLTNSIIITANNDSGATLYLTSSDSSLAFVKTHYASSWSINSNTYSATTYFSAAAVSNSTNVTLYLRKGDVLSGPIVAQTTITITDASAQYSWAASPLSVNEGASSSLVFNYVEAAGVSFSFSSVAPTGAVVDGSPEVSLNTTDFTVGGTDVAGTVTVNYSIPLDYTADGTKYFRLAAYANGTYYYSNNITVADTSTVNPSGITAINTPWNEATTQATTIRLVNKSGVVYYPRASNTTLVLCQTNSFTVPSNDFTTTLYWDIETVTADTNVNLYLRLNNSLGSIQYQTTVLIKNVLPAPTYSFTSQQNVTETQTGNSIATFTYTNVVNKTVTFSIVAPSSGTSATSGTDVTINVTSVSINGSSYYDVSYYPAADQITEGTEYFRITATVDGSIVATTSNISITDTSTYPAAGTLLSQSCAAYGVAPYTLNKVYANGNGGTYTEGTFNSPTCGYVAPTPTYTLTPGVSSVNEGSSVTFTAGGTNITNGTYYWTITNSGDFSTTSGSFTITSNSGSFSVTPTADSTTEGAETFTASIRSGSTSGTILATSSSVTINDTSTTPAAATPIWRFHRTVGSITWTVPAGITSIQVIAIAGGAGGRSQTAGGGGGGAGGAQYITAGTVTPGQVLTMTVGAGGGSNINGSSSSVTGTGVNIVAGGGITGVNSTSSNGGGSGSGNFGGGLGGSGALNAGGGGGGIGGLAGEPANGYSATAGIGGDGGASYPLFEDFPPGTFNVCGGGGGAALNEAGQGGFASGGQGAGPTGTGTNNGGAAVDHGGGGGGAKSGGTGGSGFRGMIAWYG